MIAEQVLKAGLRSDVSSLEEACFAMFAGLWKECVAPCKVEVTVAV